MHWTQEPGSVPKEDRSQFIRDNAEVLVAERDTLIERLRKRIRKLEHGRRAHKLRIAHYRQIIASLAFRCHAQSEALAARAERQNSPAKTAEHDVFRESQWDDDGAPD